MDAKIKINAGDMIAMLEARYKVKLTPITVGVGDVWYEVHGEPLAEVKLFDAIRRAHRAKKA